MRWVSAESAGAGRIPPARRLSAVAAAIEARPRDAALRLQKAELLMALKRYKDAIVSFEAAIGLGPAGLDPWAELAACHRQLGRAELALQACDRRPADAPPSAEWSTERGRALMLLGRAAEGEAELERALALGDHSLVALRSVLASLAMRGDGGALLARCDALDARYADTAAARGYRAVALSLLGRVEEARALVDLDRCVLRMRFEPPPELGPIEVFNRALADEIRAAATAEDASDRQISYHAPVAPGGAKAALLRFIRAAIDDYVARIPERGLSTAFPPPPDEAWLSSGSVILRGDASNGEHLHPEGYVSAVYHVAVPAAVATADDGRGALIVGACASQTGGHAACWGTRIIRPEPGWLVLMPSHVFHDVAPTRSSEPRIAVPADMRRIRRGAEAARHASDQR